MKKITINDMKMKAALHDILTDITIELQKAAAEMRQTDIEEFDETVTNFSMRTMIEDYADDFSITDERTAAIYSQYKDAAVRVLENMQYVESDKINICLEMIIDVCNDALFSLKEQQLTFDKLLDICVHTDLDTRLQHLEKHEKNYYCLILKDFASTVRFALYELTTD